MKKILTFTFLILLFAQSCRTSEDEKIDTYRNVVQRKSEIEQRTLFKGLTTENKLKVWQSKLDQILTQKLTKQQRIYVLIFKEEMSKTVSVNYDGIKLIETGIAMAKITGQTH